MDTNIEKVSAYSTKTKPTQKLEQGSVSLAYVKGFVKGIWEYWSEKFQSTEEESDIGLDTFEPRSRKYEIPEPKDLQAKLERSKALRNKQTSSKDVPANLRTSSAEEGTETEQTSEEQENSPDNIEHQEREITIDGKTMTVTGEISTLPNGRKLFQWQSPDGKFTYSKICDPNNSKNFSETTIQKFDDGRERTIINTEENGMQFYNDVIKDATGNITAEDKRTIGTDGETICSREGELRDDGVYYAYQTDVSGTTTIENHLPGGKIIKTKVDSNGQRIGDDEITMSGSEYQSLRNRTTGTANGTSPAVQSTTSQGIEQGGTENISNTSSPSSSTNAETPKSGGAVNDMDFTENYAEKYADFKIQVQNLSNSKELGDKWKELVRQGYSTSEATTIICNEYNIPTEK